MKSHLSRVSTSLGGTMLGNKPVTNGPSRDIQIQTKELV